MDIAAMERQLAKVYEQRKLPGVAVCMIGPDGRQYAHGFGHRDAAGEKGVDENTVFGIASMSKSMTALALCMLEAEGKLSIDDTVAKYMLEFVVPGTAQSMVTIRHLCMHTSGIPPMEALDWSIAMNSVGRQEAWIERAQKSAPNAMSEIGQIMEYIRNCPYRVLGMPGEYMSYSNEGYAVLCYVFDKASGEKLEDYLETRVYRPLGMTRTVMEDRPDRCIRLSEGNMTSLFERKGDGTVTCDDAWSVMPPYRGCATVKSTAHDMALYYRCLSNYGMHDGVQVIPRQAVERMVGEAFPLSTRPYYCLGLNKRSFEGHTVCEHGGGLHGVSTHGSFLLGEGWGFAALSNMGDDDTCEMCWAMINAVIGVDAAKSHNWSHPVSYAFDAPERLAGTYIGHEGEAVTVEVTVEDGVLRIHRDGEERTPVYCGGTLFNCYNGEELSARAEFLMRDGKAWAVRWGTRVFCREDSIR